MLISLVIGTWNRAEQLTECLRAVGAATKPDCAVEVIVVDNGSTDATKSVIHDFILNSPFETRYLHCGDPRISVARNAGIAASSGIWVGFTDDDCYISPDYFTSFHAFIKTLANLSKSNAPISYGGGQIHPFDKDDDPRMAHRYFEDFWEIPKHSLLSPAALQGANMFFRRKVLDAIGGFNAMMGPGAPFGCEDIDLACRASIAGFVGAQVPSIKVHHHHRRAKDSAAADAILENYDDGRGAYYASLLDKGLLGAWQIWSAACALENNPDPALRLRLAREMEGAAKYLRHAAAERSRIGRSPARSSGST
ncbi:MAG: glycosyltransferase family A protein [Aliidongia sp.]